MTALFILLNSAHAQEREIVLDLATVLELGGANNLTVQEYRQRQELAAADCSRAKEWWLPEVYAGVSAHQLWGAAMNADGRFFLDVNRHNLWSGLGINALWDLKEGLYRARAAGSRAEAAHYHSQAARNQAVLEIIEAYYDFLTAQLHHQAFLQLADQAQNIVQQLEIQVEAGLRYQSELLLAKGNLQHIKIERLNAKADQAIKSALLIKLLNLDAGLKIKSADTVMSPLDLTGYIDSNADHDLAYKNRPEIKAMQLEKNSIEKEKLTTTKGLFIPELQFDASTSYFGALRGPVTPMFPEQYPETQMLYPTSGINVSLMWRLPLGRLINGGALKQYNAQLMLQDNHIRQTKAAINEELVSARQQIIIFEEQIDIALEGSKLSEEALSQSIQRQELGTAQPFEILQAQEVFIKNRLDYIRAVSNYNKNQYRLYVALGNDL
ncbi:hypothetical protein BH23BAC1_BH23BAC1_43790 [soil metagenome]